MKRRNVDCGKIRRPVKRNKITEGIYGSTLLYLKFLLLWVLVILADFLLEFRFEFLWPFWLLLRSVYDSFKYQGLAFSVFFICIALTSDMICFFFIPVHWLFFAASTYVWVQYVWHTDKGICLPTILLWMLFVYLEAAVRLRDTRHLPFHLDLCRPFAAHCIGYPVVTLGFGFKSYVGYRMRQRKQKDVAKENEFYAQLLQQALPADRIVTTRPAPTQTETVVQAAPKPAIRHSHEKSRTDISNGGIVPNGSLHDGSAGTTITKNNHRKSVDKADKNSEHKHNREQTDSGANVEGNKKYAHTNGTAIDAATHLDGDYTEKGDSDDIENDKEKLTKQSSQQKSKYERKENINSQRKKQQQQQQKEADKDAEYLQRLEWDVKRLKADLQSSRGAEQELRAQVAALAASERNVRLEVAQLQRDNEELQGKMQSLTRTLQAERQSSERRAGEERRARAALEAQLAHERRAQQAQMQNKGECTEQCRQRRRELESETRELRSALRSTEERLENSDRERAAVQQQQHDAEILMSALSAMQDKNQHLEDSLSAETRIKLDLFSALGEAKRQLEIRESMIRSQEKEIEELKSKIAQVLAVMPSDTFGSPAPSSTSSRVRLADGTAGASSTLDPNATAYTPKSSLVTSTEA